jgi:hypothetical protein
VREAERFTGFTARAQNKGGLVFAKFIVKAFGSGEKRRRRNSTLIP